MNQENSAQASAKAAAFFERAERAAEKQNFDYAIDMYLEGLRCNPEALQEGHLPLRELAIVRKEKGAKKPSVMEKLKLMRGKTTIDKMLNAEFLLAKDPDHLAYGEALLKAAAAAELKGTTQWIADLLFKANNAAKKPSFRTYILLRDSYSAIGQFDRAIIACQKAAELKPNDGQLADELQRLSAELTVARGKYDQKGDFRKAIKNRQAQEKLQSQQSVVKSQEFRTSEVEEARKAFKQDQDSSKNVFRLVNALVDLQNDQADKEAIDLLENEYQKSKDFSFKQNAGQIKIKQLKRKIVKLKNALEDKPDGQQLKEQLTETSKELNNVELEHYRLCVKNYPTDVRAKYEYAVRLVQNKQYDDAIPLFQETTKDPKHRIPAMSKIGLCFFKKEWYADAIDVFNETIKTYNIKDDSVAKELRYNLGRAYEEQKNIEKALAIYRKIAQQDFGYKDVRNRVNKLRKMENEN